MTRSDETTSEGTTQMTTTSTTTEMIAKSMNDYTRSEQLVDDLVKGATEPMWAAVVEVFEPENKLFVVDQAGRAYLEGRYGADQIKIQYESSTATATERGYFDSEGLNALADLLTDGETVQLTATQLRQLAIKIGHRSVALTITPGQSRRCLEADI